MIPDEDSNQLKSSRTRDVEAGGGHEWQLTVTPRADRFDPRVW